jgi:hypothetical protein
MHLHAYDSRVFKNDSTELVGLAVTLQTCIQDYSIFVLGPDTVYPVEFCDCP